jgi:hypothetical protein
MIAGLISRALALAVLFAIGASVTAAHAVDGTWTGPGSEWTTGTNWSSTPTVPDGTATFTGNLPTSVTISDDASINTIQFNAGAPQYSFSISGGVGPIFNINGTGIVNN